MSDNIRVSLAELEKASWSENATKKLASNIGDIGIAPDFSNNMLRTPLQNDFPLLQILLQSALSTSMRNIRDRGLSAIHKDEDGVWQLMLPYTVGTLPPADTTGLCCWVPFDITRCGDTIPLNLLCLRDCECILDILINRERRAGRNDLTGYFMRQGETVRDARDRMNRLSMAWFTALTIYNGISTAGTEVLKPFHGIREIMEDDAVIKIFGGANPLWAFNALWCRLSLFDATGANFVISAHPLVIDNIRSFVRPGMNGMLPDGWTMTGNELRFRGIRFVPDKFVPYDIATGTGDAWVIDLSTTGIYLGTTLAPQSNFIYDQFSGNNEPDECCGEECRYYYNYGGAFNTNPNTLAVITDIPASANCSGSVLAGLDNLIIPNTLVPMV